MNPLLGSSVGFDDFVAGLQTPAIAYDLPRLARTAGALQHLVAPFDGRVHFAVKANRNCRILETFAQLGWGVDIASAAEFTAARCAGHYQIVATAPGLNGATIAAVAGAGGTVFFDSLDQLAVARRLGVDPSAHGLRITPGGAYDHFGLIIEEVLEAFPLGDRPRRLHLHSGEIENLDRLSLVLAQAGQLLDVCPADLLDLGGGYAVLSNDWSMMQKAFDRLGQFSAARDVRLAFEFGKVAVARCGVLATRITSVKARGASQVIVVDASAYNLGMMETRRLRLSRADGVPTKIVGPTCYEGDVFAAKALAPRAAAGEVLVFAHCGAYASSLASSLHGLDPIPEYVFE